PSTAWIPTAAADFNRDGTPDLFYWNKNTGKTSIWYMGGTGGKQRLSNVLVDTNGISFPGTSWVPTSAADFDGSGTPDLFYWNKTSGKTSIWYMVGANGSQRQSNLAVDPNGVSYPGTSWVPTAASDFDGDGVPDTFYWNR